MEINDEDVVHGTDLQKYLKVIGYSEFEVPKPTNDKKQYNSKNCCIKKPKCSKKFKNPTQNNEDFKICIKLIKICLESKLMFKEDISFIKEFIPSDNKKYPSIFTKQNSFILLIVLCTCFTKYCVEAIGILVVLFGYMFGKILYNMNYNRKMKNIVLKTIKSMEKSSELIQTSTRFIHECNNLYTSCYDTYVDKNIHFFMYLLMPELKSTLLNVLQDLINHLIYNISEVHTFFPLKDFISNVVYLYLTDCEIDVKNTSLENINKAKYTYFLLQSELLKQLSLCCCPMLWKPESCPQINRLVKTIENIEKVYLNSYSVLLEEYNIYLLFKNNNIEHNKQPCTDTYINSDIQMKIYNIRQSLQAMTVNIRFMDDLIHNSSNNCTDDVNSTFNVLLKEAKVFNELISTLQIYILKPSKDNKNKILLPNNKCIEDIKHEETEINLNKICEDELFVGISEKPVGEANSTFCDEIIFDKSNNYNLMLELNIALKNKQMEWKLRESKLLEKHPQFNDTFNEEDDEELDQFTNKTRKVDLLPNEMYSTQLSNGFANDIANIACKWNPTIECFGDDIDSDS